MSAAAAAEKTLDATFAALADPTRRAILARLAAGEASVTELAAPFSMSQPAVSSTKVLERARLIARPDAQRRPRRLEGGPARQASARLDRYRAHAEATPGSTPCSRLKPRSGAEDRRT
jgi:DNA-binding transcriptional ArsR family regulator